MDKQISNGTLRDIHNIARDTIFGYDKIGCGLIVLMMLMICELKLIKEHSYELWSFAFSHVFSVQ